ncbi:MAG: carboxypeptidase-like regulatory domain-containing protein [Acidobacteria bacterium]|nr:carboxypeptidase-like regulatory domain-containing protein [Acidobacteriota bacterium]
MKALRGMLLCLILSAAAVAQTSTGRMEGTVQDPTGAVVPNASVVVTNEETGVSFNTQASDAGKYSFEALPPGRYTVAVEAAGFKKLVSTQNVLTANDTVTINAALEAGNIAETVQVTGSYERVQTSQSGNIGTVVTEQSLNNLPIAGRNPLNLITYQPGVIQDVGGGRLTGGGTHVFGARDRAINITLDGIDANETSAGNATFTPIRTNPDSLQEYRVITSNPSAEFGRNSGAQVALVTKTGTNEFHGNLFWYHRNRALNANEWELNRQGVPRRFLLRNQFGGSLGGPIVKNKTFFFFNTQVQRQIQTLEQTNTVLTAAARQGIFRYVVGGRNFPAGVSGASVDANGNPLLPACGGAVTTNCIATYGVAANDPRALGLDPTVQSIIGLTPAPNRFDVGDGLNTAGFTSLARRTDPQRDFNARVDHTLSQSHSLFGRYSWGQQDTVGDTTNSGAARFPGLPPIVATFRTPKNLAVGLRSTLSSRTTNELIFGGNRFVFDFVIPSNLDERATPVDVATFTDPLSNSFGNKRTINTFQVLDNIAHVRGEHTFRTGFNFRLQEHYDVRGSVAGLDVNPLYALGGTIDAAAFGARACTATITTRCLPGINTANDLPRLNSFINDMLGKVNSVAVGLVDTGGQYGPPGTAFSIDAWYPEFDLYFQDDWKLRSNLTLNLGLRYEPKPAPYTRGATKIFVPNKPFTLGAPPANDITFVEGDLYKSDWNNLGPAVGVAWDPFGDGRTAVRGNFRIAFDRVSTFLPSSAVYPAVPGITLAAGDATLGQRDFRVREITPSLLLPPAGATPTSLARPAAPNTSLAQELFDPEFATPITHMWSLGVQREIGWKMVAEAQYIGRAGRNLIGGYERNQVRIRENGFLEAFKVAAAGGESELLDRLTRPDPRRGATETSTTFLRRLFNTPLTRGEVASLAATLNNTVVCVGGTGTACAGGVRRSLPDAAGLGAFFFNDYPQFLAGLQVIDSNSFSNYHGGVFSLSRRYERGMEFNVAYTWSKSMDDKSYDPTFTRISGGTGQSAQSTPFDATDRRLNYGRSDFDRTHVLQGTGLFDLPFGPGRRWGSDANGLVSRLIGGWTVTSNFLWQSGQPFSVVSGTNTLSNRASSRANFSGTNFTPRYRNDPVTGVPFLFTPEERAQFSLPGPGELGNTGRNQFRLPPHFVMDASVIKRVRITETKNFEFRTQIFNLLNNVYLGFPSSGVNVLSGSTFSRDLTSDSSARVIEMAVRFNF